MSLDLPEPLSALLTYGLPGVFVLAMVEKLIPIIPSYVLYVFLGMVTVNSVAELGSTLAVSVLGAMLGGLVWYGVGRAIGEHRIEATVSHYGRYVLLSSAIFDRLRRAYRRNALLVTGVGHAIPVVRFYLPIPAGVLALNLPGFLVASGLGCVVWNGLLLGLGYALSDTGLPAVHVGLVAILALLAIEATAAILIRRRMRGDGRTDAAVQAA